MARILIVEDETLVSMLLEDLLMDLGHEITNTVPTVIAALDAIADDPPDCVILDVNLGEESGYPVAEELSRREIPYAFATGFGRHDIDGNYSHTPVLAKPFDERKLDSIVNELLSQPAGG